MPIRLRFVAVLLAGLVGYAGAVRCAPADQPAAEAALVPDTAVVRAKIQGLAIRDDTVPNEQRPEVWLRRWPEQCVPQLIAALNDPNATVAEKCLQILNEMPPSAQVLAALLPIAGDANHRINAAATMALVRYPSDETAARLMAAAYPDERRFPKPLHRAALAAGAGKNADAIAILMIVAAKAKDETDAVRAVEQLSAIGSDAVPALAEVSHGRRWTVAVHAYNALDKLDPQNHALTADQREIIERLGRSFKADAAFYRERARELSALDRRQVRPFVMQALASTEYQPPRVALIMLTVWKDRAALPEIRKVIENSRAFACADAMAAYLTIDGGAASEQLLLDRTMREKSGPMAEEFVRAVLDAPIADQRRVDLLLRIRGVLNDSPYAIPHSLGFFEGDLGAILPPLMDSETDIRALGAYAERAGDDKQNRFGPQIVRALHQLAAVNASTDDDELLPAAREILNSAARQHLKGAEKDIAALTAAKSPALRIAALSAAVRISGALDKNAGTLLDDLASPDIRIRSQAAEGLEGLKLNDEGQRQKVEAALLSHLGKPSEDYSMRLLANFGGTAAAQSLMPLLDDPQVPRAVYAAWVLSQIPAQPAARDAAMRRLAINGRFHRFLGQQSSGISFPVSPGISFGQVTYINPQPDQDDREPVQIPPELLQSMELTPAEQRFSIAAYRYACLMPGLYALGTTSPPVSDMNARYIPLLQVIASEDPRIQELFVKNEKVAYFPDRHTAAKQVALITGKPASYLGLAGESLSSEQTPLGPYPNQAALIARFAIDRVLKGLPADSAQTDAQWSQTNWRNELLGDLDRRFGVEVRDAIVKEIRRRGLAETFVKIRLVEQWLTK